MLSLQICLPLSFNLLLLQASFCDLQASCCICTFDVVVLTLAGRGWLDAGEEWLDVSLGVGVTGQLILLVSGEQSTSLQ